MPEHLISPYIPGWGNTNTTNATVTYTVPIVTTSSAATTIVDETWRSWNLQSTTYPTYPVWVLRRQQARSAAQVKAMRLLNLVLSDEQRAELAQHRRFHVVGNRGRRYRIHADGQSGNVSWIGDDGMELGRFCAHPGQYLPDADAWLAQALALQTDEDAFLRVANVHAGRRPVLLMPERTERVGAFAA